MSFAAYHILPNALSARGAFSLIAMILRLLFRSIAFNIRMVLLYMRSGFCQVIAGVDLQHVYGEVRDASVSPAILVENLTRGSVLQIKPRSQAPRANLVRSLYPPTPRRTLCENKNVLRAFGAGGWGAHKHTRICAELGENMLTLPNRL